MRVLVCLLLQLQTILLYAQDPNAHLKIDSETIQMVCFAAKKPAIDIYESIKGFTVFEQILFEAEGYSEDDIGSLLKTNPQKPFEIIRDAWNNKWARCWCKPDSHGAEGYVDVLLLSTQQFQAIRNIYNPKGRIKANINKAVTLSPYARDENPMTLLDLTNLMVKERWGQLGYRQSLAKAIQTFSGELEDYGFREFKELSPEEQKIQIELMNKALGKK